MEQMEIEQEPSRIADVTVFRLQGPFTLTTIFGFQATLRAPEIKGAIVDLSGVPYIDSAGLGVLLGQFAQSQRNGAKFALAGLTHRVHTIFEITHTDTILPIFATVADAEAKLA